MKTVEQFKEIIGHYYQRDYGSKQRYADFISEEAEGSLRKFFNRLPSIEKKFKVTLPQDYKTFIESACAWGLEGESNEFRIYDKQDILEFNYLP